MPPRLADLVVDRVARLAVHHRVRGQQAHARRADDVILRERHHAARIRVVPQQVARAANEAFLVAFDLLVGALHRLHPRRQQAGLHRAVERVAVALRALQAEPLEDAIEETHGHTT